MARSRRSWPRVRPERAPSDLRFSRVLPAPLSPTTRACTSPARTARSMPASACSGPKARASPIARSGTDEVVIRRALSTRRAAIALLQGRDRRCAGLRFQRIPALRGSNDLATIIGVIDPRAASEQCGTAGSWRSWLAGHGHAAGRALAESVRRLSVGRRHAGSGLPPVGVARKAATSARTRSACPSWRWPPDSRLTSRAPGMRAAAAEAAS